MRPTFRILETPMSRHEKPSYVHVDMVQIERRVITHFLDPEWMDCPQCKQSATGRYNGRHSCNRCGWVQSSMPEMSGVVDVKGQAVYTTVTGRIPSRIGSR